MTPLQHDVLALAWRPDGKQLASSTLDGQIYFWDPHEAVLQVGCGAGQQQREQHAASGM